MPAPGDQHVCSGAQGVNPFEELKPRVSIYTAQEIATLQSRLEKQLGPEYISTRAGPSGQKVHYITAEKCIQLANEVFGFNGWSSEIKDVSLDFLDELPQTMRFNIGISVIIRVTLRDGTFHEDVGYGNIDNCKGKAAAFEKAKKEATTDALKRALKNFGNVLGNCIYDKEYLSKVTKLKVEKPRWDVANLHRHSDYMPRKEKQVDSQKGYNMEKKATDSASTKSESTLEDEFGDFDEADFSIPDPDAHPDEVVLPRQRAPPGDPSKASNGNNARPVPNQSVPSINNQPAMRHPNTVQNSSGGTVAPQPQTPNAGFTRAASSGPILRSQDGQPGPAVVAGRVLNQPNRMGPPAPGPAPVSPSRPAKPPTSEDGDNSGLPPAGQGFYSARAAAMVPDTTSGESLPLNNPNLPAFNPRLESPSIRKTPGVDHRSSKPLTKDLKHVPGSSQAPAVPAAGRPGIGRGGALNPQLDGVRQIGIPGTRAMSPMQNRGGYKPPTMKRPLDGEGGDANRTPLANLPANGPVTAGDDGGEAKRQRVNG